MRNRILNCFSFSTEVEIIQRYLFALHVLIAGSKSLQEFNLADFSHCGLLIGLLTAA